MPRPKSFDEDAVLDKAVQLFWERGYEGTSLADLEAHLGLGRQSLYNTFGDKEALAPLDAPGAGLDGIRAFFRATIENLTAPGERKTCLIINTLLERGSQDADALLRCNRSQEGLQRAFRRALTRAKSSGDLPDSVDIEAAATLLVVQSYGLNVLAKTGATAGELQATVEVLLSGLR
jgi:TetR/AcrR family transcriptional regulator, transcriptional repressor for nem operon